MSITENFLVNTKNFESIIQELRSVDKIPGKLNNTFLERLGYSNPSDLLVLHLFKDLEMLEQDGTPTPLFKKFRNDSTTNIAMAEGITNAYAELFKSNAQVYKLQQDELKEEFKKFFGSNKSELILKYMANTFQTLVNYAGLKTMEEVAGERFDDSNDNGSSVNQVSEHQNNGSDKTPATGADSEEEIAVVDANDNIRKEEKGKAAIEDFFPKKDDEDEGEEEEPKGSADDKSEPKSGTDSDTKSEADSESKSDSASGSKSDLEIDLEKELQSGGTADDIDDSEPETEAEAEEESELKRRIESTKKEIEEQQKEKEKNREEDREKNEPGMNGSIVEHISKGADSASKLDSGDAGTEDEADPFGFDDDDSSDELEDLDLTEDLDLEEEPPQAKGNKEYLDKAFVKKAELLYKLEKYEEALPAYKTIVDRYRDSDDSFLQEHVSKAIIRRASILGKLQRYDEALPAYDDVIDRFENSDKTEFYNYASEALIKKIEIMEMLELDEPLMPLYTKLVKRLGDSEDPRFASQVDKAFVKVAKMKLDSGEPEKALKAINGVIKRFANKDRENEFLEQAMYQKAELLEQLGRDEEALEAYESFLSKFGSDS